MITGVLGELASTFVGWGLLVVGVLIAWFTAKSNGKAIVRAEQAEQVAKESKAAANKQFETVVKANAQTEDVNAMSDVDVINELHTKWRTPDK